MYIYQNAQHSKYFTFVDFFGNLLVFIECVISSGSLLNLFIAQSVGLSLAFFFSHFIFFVKSFSCFPFSVREKILNSFCRRFIRTYFQLTHESNGKTVILFAYKRTRIHSNTRL